MKYLVLEHGLDTQPGKKTPVYIEDIGPFNETILSMQEKIFYLGFQRIQVCLFNSLGLFTVHQEKCLVESAVQGPTDLPSEGSSWRPTRPYD
jgi:hypothetical protein